MQISFRRFVVIWHHWCFYRLCSACMSPHYGSLLHNPQLSPTLLLLWMSHHGSQSGGDNCTLSRSSVFIILSQARCCSQQERRSPAESHLAGLDFSRFPDGFFLKEMERNWSEGSIIHVKKHVVCVSTAVPLCGVGSSACPRSPPHVSCQAVSRFL